MKADLVLVDRGGDEVVDRDLPTLKPFEIALVRARIAGKDMWIDPTDRDQVPGQLSATEQDDPALVIADGTLITTPASVAADNTITETRTFTPTAESDGAVREVSHEGGVFEADQRQWIRSTVGRRPQGPREVRQGDLRRRAPDLLGHGSAGLQQAVRPDRRCRPRWSYPHEVVDDRSAPARLRYDSTPASDAARKIRCPSRTRARGTGAAGVRDRESDHRPRRILDACRPRRAHARARCHATDGAASYRWPHVHRHVSGSSSRRAGCLRPRWMQRAPRSQSCKNEQTELQFPHTAWALVDKG